MEWRFLGNMFLLGLVFLLHGLHSMHGMPQTYDDPKFVDKMIPVILAFVAIIVAHLIQREEDKLKSTR